MKCPQFQCNYLSNGLTWVFAVLGLIALVVCPFLIGCQAVDTTTTASRSAQVMVNTEHDGYELYQQHCASCHAENGQGVDEEYDEPLFGDRAMASLARYIERRMPDDDPELVMGQEARDVTDYIYHEFYSVEARHRKGLIPKIQLTRLTVPQYRNAVADMVLHFTPEVSQSIKKEISKEQEEQADCYEFGEGVLSERPIEPGLLAQYYQSKGMNKANELMLERVDKKLQFDFDLGTPSPSITPDQFSAIWQGSLFARETGHYEFRIRTQNGARLYLNSENLGQRKRMRDDSSEAGQAALIDGWVSSGKMRELTERVYLLGGRHYPIRLEFFKYLEKTASVQLEWKPPHGTWMVLDHNHTSTLLSPRTFVVDTAFPADDRSFGYERAISVTPSWPEATTQGAVATAEEIVTRLPLLAELTVDEEMTSKEEEDESREMTGEEKVQMEQWRHDQVKAFVLEFAQLAYRRPLQEDQIRLISEALLGDAGPMETAVRRAIIFILKSPNFLYADLSTDSLNPGPFDLANRLALALWDSIPDTILWEAAAEGQLSDDEALTAQAHRMLKDPRAQSKMRHFFNHWLELEERDLAKDKTLFPEFDEAVIAELRHSLDLFIDQIVWSESSDYRDLLRADYLYLSDKLEDLYAQEPEEGPPFYDWQRPKVTEFKTVEDMTLKRSGVLTHPYLLSAFAYHNNTSPIHRGVFITRNIVGRELKTPPDDVEFNDEEFAPDATMREKITQLTRDQACMSCHSVINPFGFALENFDAVGRWRTEENNKQVVTLSEYVTADGDIVKVESARDIANFAINSESAHRTFVTQLFEHLVKQPPLAYGLDTVDELQQEFVAKEFSIQNIMIEIALRSAKYEPLYPEVARSAP